MAGGFTTIALIAGWLLAAAIPALAIYGAIHILARIERRRAADKALAYGDVIPNAINPRGE